jgi:subtilisin family serine protease
VRILTLLLVLISVTACEITDNQKIVKADALSIANPLPEDRDFVAQNKAHKILVAVIDSGVDYNHAKLTKHIHFTLDSNGKPTGAGHDFVADDKWPSPYIVRTAHYDPIANEERKADAVLALANIEKAALYLSKWSTTLLHPIRAVDQEIAAGTFHGTHVAGLSVYDKPEIGLLPYRVLPRNITGPGPLDAEDLEVVAKQLFSAVEMAAEAGAKVINISLGFSAKESEDTEFDKIKALSDQWDALVAKHPNILFVAAAGNDGAWIDQTVRINFPCGSKLPNLLCVGSLAEDSEVSDFTNVVLSGAEIVFALGEDVISTFPEKMCPSSALRAVATAKDETAYHNNVEQFKQECEKYDGLAPQSGTSMASPITARIAALHRIEKPDATPAQVIELIKAAGSKGTIGTYEITKLAVEKPSWYRGQLPIWNMQPKWNAFVPKAGSVNR